MASFTSSSGVQVVTIENQKDAPPEQDRVQIVTIHNRGGGEASGRPVVEKVYDGGFDSPGSTSMDDSFEADAGLDMEVEEIEDESNDETFDDEVEDEPGPGFTPQSSPMETSLSQVARQPRKTGNFTAMIKSRLAGLSQRKPKVSLLQSILPKPNSSGHSAVKKKSTPRALKSVPSNVQKPTGESFKEKVEKGNILKTVLPTLAPQDARRDKIQRCCVCKRASKCVLCPCGESGQPCDITCRSPVCQFKPQIRLMGDEEDRTSPESSTVLSSLPSASSSSSVSPVKTNKPVNLVDRREIYVADTDQDASSTHIVLGTTATNASQSSPQAETPGPVAKTPKKSTGHVAKSTTVAVPNDDTMHIEIIVMSEEEDINEVIPDDSLDEFEEIILPRNSVSSQPKPKPNPVAPSIPKENTAVVKPPEEQKSPVPVKQPNAPKPKEQKEVLKTKSQPKVSKPKKEPKVSKPKVNKIVTPPVPVRKSKPRKSVSPVRMEEFEPKEQSPLAEDTEEVITVISGNVASVSEVRQLERSASSGRRFGALAMSPRRTAPKVTPKSTGLKKFTPKISLGKKGNKPKKKIKLPKSPTVTDSPKKSVYIDLPTFTDIHHPEPDCVCKIVQVRAPSPMAIIELPLPPRMSAPKGIESKNKAGKSRRSLTKGGKHRRHSVKNVTPKAAVSPTKASKASSENTSRTATKLPWPSIIETRRQSGKFGSPKKATEATIRTPEASVPANRSPSPKGQIDYSKWFESGSENVTSQVDVNTKSKLSKTNPQNGVSEENTPKAPFIPSNKKPLARRLSEESTSSSDSAELRISTPKTATLTSPEAVEAIRPLVRRSRDSPGSSSVSEASTDSPSMSTPTKVHTGATSVLSRNSVKKAVKRLQRPPGHKAPPGDQVRSPGRKFVPSSGASFKRKSRGSQDIPKLGASFVQDIEHYGLQLSPILHSQIEKEKSWQPHVDVIKSPKTDMLTSPASTRTQKDDVAKASKVEATVNLSPASVKRQTQKRESQDSSPPRKKLRSGEMTSSATSPCMRSPSATRASDASVKSPVSGLKSPVSRSTRFITVSSPSVTALKRDVVSPPSKDKRSAFGLLATLATGAKSDAKSPSVKDGKSPGTSKTHSSTSRSPAANPSSKTTQASKSRSNEKTSSSGKDSKGSKSELVKSPAGKLSSKTPPGSKSSGSEKFAGKDTKTSKPESSTPAAVLFKKKVITKSDLEKAVAMKSKEVRSKDISKKVVASRLDITAKPASPLLSLMREARSSASESEGKSTRSPVKPSKLSGTNKKAVSSKAAVRAQPVSPSKSGKLLATQCKTPPGKSSTEKTSDSKVKSPVAPKSPSPKKKAVENRPEVKKNFSLESVLKTRPGAIPRAASRSRARQLLKKAAAKRQETATRIARALASSQRTKAEAPSDKPKPIRSALKCGFGIGLRLEAIDKNNPDFICVASVVDIKAECLRVHFDGWESGYDFWCKPDSPYIHPVGWCQRNAHALSPPQDWPNVETFTWEEYLAVKKAKAVPESAFKHPSNATQTKHPAPKSPPKLEYIKGDARPEKPQPVCPKGYDPVVEIDRLSDGVLNTATVDLRERPIFATKKGSGKGKRAHTSPILSPIITQVSSITNEMFTQGAQVIGEIRLSPVTIATDTGRGDRSRSKRRQSRSKSYGESKASSASTDKRPKHEAEGGESTLHTSAPSSRRSSISGRRAESDVSETKSIESDSQREKTASGMGADSSRRSEDDGGKSRRKRSKPKKYPLTSPPLSSSEEQKLSESLEHQMSFEEDRPESGHGTEQHGHVGAAGGKTGMARDRAQVTSGVVAEKSAADSTSSETPEKESNEGSSAEQLGAKGQNRGDLDTSQNNIKKKRAAGSQTTSAQAKNIFDRLDRVSGKDISPKSTDLVTSSSADVTPSTQGESSESCHTSGSGVMKNISDRAACLSTDSTEQMVDTTSSVNTDQDTEIEEMPGFKLSDFFSPSAPKKPKLYCVDLVKRSTSGSGYQCVLCEEGRETKAADALKHITDEHTFCSVCVQSFSEVHLFIEHVDQHAAHPDLNATAKKMSENAVSPREVKVIPADLVSQSHGRIFCTLCDDVFAEKNTAEQHVRDFHLKKEEIK